MVVLGLVQVLSHVYEFVQYRAQVLELVHYRCRVRVRDPAPSMDQERSDPHVRVSIGKIVLGLPPVDVHFEEPGMSGNNVKNGIKPLFLWNYENAVLRYPK